VTTNQVPHHEVNANPDSTGDKQARIVTRLAAGIVDTVLLAIIGLLWLRFLQAYRWLSLLVLSALWVELEWYLRGSPGKAAFNLSVDCASRRSLYLREIVGKLISSFTLGIGYLSILSSERKALHDYIAGSKVVAKARNARVATAVRYALVALFPVIGVLSFIGFHGPSQSNLRSREANPKWSLHTAIPAVMTINVSRHGQPYVQGSGFLITADGIAVTNVHVLGQGDAAEVELEDGRKYRVLEVDNFDMSQDIAIFKIGESSLDFPSLSLSDSSDMEIGDKVTVISSPEGLSNTVSEGILSARRSGPRTLMQITAPISPGSSGAPVFDGNGKVVGVARSQLTSGQNLNFAIPVEEVIKLKELPPQHLSMPRFFSIVNSRENDDRASQRDASATTEAKLQGTYVGTVRNLEANVESDSVIFVSQDGERISGCFGVLKPLYGSGPFNGTIQYPDVQFYVESDQMGIRFDGKMDGVNLEGTYLVRLSNGEQQHGTFSLVRRNRKSIKTGPESCPTDE
jgi:S1-C subfamily serine protease